MIPKGLWGGYPGTCRFPQGVKDGVLKTTPYILWKKKVGGYY